MSTKKDKPEEKKDGVQTGTAAQKPQAPVKQPGAAEKEAAKAEAKKNEAKAAEAAEASKKAAEEKAAADKKAAAEAAGQKKEKATVQVNRAKAPTLIETIEACFAARKKVYKKQISEAEMTRLIKEFTAIVRKIHASKDDECYEALLAYMTKYSGQINDVIKEMNAMRCSVSERNSVAMMMGALNRIAAARRNEDVVSLNVEAIRSDCVHQELTNFLISKNDG